MAPKDSRRAKGDGSLYKRADGLWVGAVSLPPHPDGKRRVKRVTAKSRNEAILRLRKLKADVAAGLVPIGPSTTVERWMRYWVDEILPFRNIKPATVYGYESAVELHLIPNLGAKRLDRLAPS